MKNLAFGLVVFVAVAHVWFMVLESVLWTRPFGLKTFGQTPDEAGRTKVLALNQGVYNGGIAALLLWAALDERGLTAGRNPTVDALLIFIVAMGVVGGVTAKPVIIALQAAPAALALLARHL